MHSGKSCKKKRVCYPEKKGLYDTMHSSPCVMTALAFHYMQKISANEDYQSEIYPETFSV